MKLISSNEIKTDFPQIIVWCQKLQNSRKTAGDRFLSKASIDLEKDLVFWSKTLNKVARRLCLLSIIVLKKCLNQRRAEGASENRISKLLPLVTALLLTALSTEALALQRTQGQYLLVDERPLALANNGPTTQFTTPQNLLSQSWTQAVSQTTLSLLKWALFKENTLKTYEDYDRKKHFGTWVNDPNDHSCMNTRAKVLARDSATQVILKGSNNCEVDRGTWKDPYTRQVYHSASEIQIDHMVPLKNAYQSGAWKWNFYTRCLYANYMGNPVHLLSVQGQANMAKSDKSPDQWLPPNESYRCEYIRNWLLVKLIWRLEMTATESEGIKQALVKYRCPLNSYGISIRDFQTQRNLIQANAQECAHLKPQ